MIKKVCFVCFMLLFLNSATVYATPDIEASFTKSWGTIPPLYVFNEPAIKGIIYSETLTGIINDARTIVSSCGRLYNYKRYAVARQTIIENQKYYITITGAARGNYPGIEGYIKLFNGWTIEKINSKSVGDYDNFFINTTNTINFRARGACPACACYDGGAININITVSKGDTIPTYPTPTASATILVSGNNWQDIIQAQSTGRQVIFTDTITDKIKNEIITSNTDQLWTLGDIKNIDQLNATKIQTKDHINNIFFNTTEKYYTDKEHAIMAALLAAKDNIPLTFTNNNAEDLTLISNEQLTERYLENHKENIDNIIITNTNTELAFIAPQISKKYKGIPLIINTPITPNNNITQNQIKKRLTTLATNLSKKGLYTKNKDYKLSPVYITILGDFNAIPPYQMDDKGRELIINIDGNLLLSDLPYADFYDNGKIDASIGRITNKNQLYTNEKLTNAKLLGQYRHGKYADVIFLDGGMLQAYDTKKILENENLNINRSVESRINLTTDTLKDIKDLAKNLYDFAKKTGKHTLGGFLNFIKTFMDLASMIMSIFFETDWDNWEWYLLELPPHLDNLNTNTFESLENTQILAFFGVGNDKEIKLSKEDRSDFELIFTPYWNGPKVTQLNYNNFFMLDYDMSGYLSPTNIPTQITNKGAYGFAATGIVHDPYSWSFTSPIISYLTEGNTLGEALLNTIKNKPYEKYMKFMPHKYIGNELFDLETKNTYERIILGNPKTRLFEQKYQYLSSNTITTSTQTIKQTKTQNIQTLNTQQPTFTIKETITNNYEIINNTLKTDAQEYIMYPGFPIIPIKTTTITLPQNTNIQNVKITPTYNTYENLNITYTPYDQYYNLNITQINEQFPDIKYTYETYTNPDNTIELQIITPYAIYNNTKTEVLKTAEIEITYTSPMEITDIIAKNITTNNNQTITITFESTINENGKLYLYLDNQEYESKNINITPQTNTYTYNINTPEIGRHAITIIYDGETSIESKHANFYVFDPVFTLQPPAKLNKEQNQKSTHPFKFTVLDRITGLFILDENCIVKTETKDYPCGQKQDTTKINIEDERYHTNIELKTLNKGTNIITASILGYQKEFEIMVK